MKTCLLCVVVVVVVPVVVSIIVVIVVCLQDQALIYLSQDPDSDVGKQLVSEGLLLVDNKRRDRRYKQLVNNTCL